MFQRKKNYHKILKLDKLEILKILWPKPDKLIMKLAKEEPF